MTQPSSVSQLVPDSFTGAIYAFEGLTDAVGVINGPTGCKYYTSFLVDYQDPRGSTLNPHEYGGPPYFGQPRAPASAAEEADYIYGTATKLEPVLRQVSARAGTRLVGIVNTCGTSLIGDDVRGTVQRAGIPQPVVVVDTSGFTGSMACGFQEATCRLLREQVPPVAERIPRGVNLVGVSIGHFNWENDLEELRRNLGALGAQVVAAVTAGASLEELRRAPAAALNVVVHEEYGGEVARAMERLYGTPWVGVDEGAPFGLEGVEAWLGTVADRLGLSREPVLEESKGVRRRLYTALARASTLRGFPKGFSFALGGNASVVAAWLPFLHRYIGLHPVLLAIHEAGERSLAQLRAYLGAEWLDPPVLMAPDHLQLRDAMQDAAPQVILGSTIERMLARSLWPDFEAFVEISFPVFGRVTLTHRPLAGLRGPLALVEDLLNRSGAILSAAI